MNCSPAFLNMSFPFPILTFTSLCQKIHSAQVIGLFYHLHTAQVLLKSKTQQFIFRWKIHELAIESSQQTPETVTRSTFHSKNSADVGIRTHSQHRKKTRSDSSDERQINRVDLKASTRLNQFYVEKKSFVYKTFFFRSCIFFMEML